MAKCITERLRRICLLYILSDVSYFNFRAKRNDLAQPKQKAKTKLPSAKEVEVEYNKYVLKTRLQYRYICYQYAKCSDILLLKVMYIHKITKISRKITFIFLGYFRKDKFNLHFIIHIVPRNVLTYFDILFQGRVQNSSVPHPQSRCCILNERIL